MWLKSHDLAALQPVLESNGIDVSTAPLLTDDDLIKLGLDLGARRKLLAAARELRPGTLPNVSPERRQLTVMFCDLVAWTERSQNLDAEVQGAILDRFRKHSSDVAESLGGFVAQVLGDGMMIYFGWPQAHEDDAERSVRAAIEIANGVPNLPVSPPLRVRIGIATGLVIVGSEREEVSALAVGEAPNLAARLMSIAEPGQIVIAPSTRQLLAETFELTSLGEHVLKGIIDPVEVYGVIAPHPVRARFERRVGPGRIGPMFGRDAELNGLLAAWRSARHGKGGVALVSGVAGIGKSRLVHALKDELVRTADRYLQLDCSPHRSGTALYPLIELVRQDAGISEQDDDAERLRKLRNVVEDRGQAEAAVGFIADLLSVPRGPIPAASLSGQKHKEMTLDALMEYVTVLGRSAPLALIIEDVHWADPTTIELISRVLPATNNLHLLVVLTFRPEFFTSWPLDVQSTVLELGRLAPSAVEAIVREVKGDRDLPADVEAEVASRTDGIPLYAEELTKAALSGSNRGDRTVLPTTLQDSLLAQLDPLGEAKFVVQVAACLGRDFDGDVLSEVVEAKGARRALRVAVEARLLFAQGEPSDQRYIFGHSLIRDAAYECLPFSRRTALHLRIGDVLETKFPNRAADSPEIVGHHLTLGHAYERAIRYWIKAGERAIRRFEMPEARAHFMRGLDLLQHRAKGNARDTLELHLQHGVGTALGSSMGYTPPEVGAAFGRAFELAQIVGDFSERGSIIFGLWLYYLMRADYQHSAPLAREFLDMAEQSGEPERLVAAHGTFGCDRFFVGGLHDTVSHYQVAWDLYEQLGEPPIHRQYGMNGGPLAADFLAFSAQIMGLSDRSVRYHEMAIAAAERAGDPVTLGTGLAHATMTAGLRLDVDATERLGRRCVEYCRQSGVFIREVEAEIMLGWVEVARGDSTSGIETLDGALAKWNSIGAHIADTFFLDLIATSYWKAGRGDEARQAARQAVEVAERAGELLFLPEAKRIEGDLRLALDSDLKGALECYVSAIEIARNMDARWWELRSTVGYARVLKRLGRVEEGHGKLAAVYGWFTEGLHQPDLQEARELLAELEAARLTA